MRDIYYSTENEKKLIIAAQKKLNIDPNGIIGMNTLSTLFFRAGVELDEPVTLLLYNYPTIISNDLLVFSPKTSIKGFKNSMAGSFTYPRGETPCSIMINSYHIYHGVACHAHAGAPESVIYRNDKDELNIKRVYTADELPQNVKWAVGGMGLQSYYDPKGEGFTGAYSDVLRKTNHNVLGVKNNKVYGVYFKNLTAEAINDLCVRKFRFDFSILLDGGGKAAINGSENFAKINTSEKQGYAIQFI